MPPVGPGGDVAILQAEKLLLQVVGQDRYVQLNALGFYELPGKTHASYSLAKRRKTHITGHDGAIWNACVDLTVGDCPQADRIVAEHYLILNDEAKYLQTANLTLIQPLAINANIEGPHPGMAGTEYLRAMAEIRRQERERLMVGNWDVGGGELREPCIRIDPAVACQLHPRPGFPFRPIEIATDLVRQVFEGAPRYRIFRRGEVEGITTPSESRLEIGELRPLPFSDFSRYHLAILAEQMRNVLRGNTVIGLGPPFAWRDTDGRSVCAADLDGRWLSVRLQLRGDYDIRENRYFDHTTIFGYLQIVVPV